MGSRGSSRRDIVSTSKSSTPCSRPLRHHLVPLQKRGSHQVAALLVARVASRKKASDCSAADIGCRLERLSRNEGSEMCPHIGEARARTVNAVRAQKKGFADCRSRFTASNVLNAPVRGIERCRSPSVLMAGSKGIVMEARTRFRSVRVHKN